MLNYHTNWLQYCSPVLLLATLTSSLNVTSWCRSTSIWSRSWRLRRLQPISFVLSWRTRTQRLRGSKQRYAWVHLHGYINAHTVTHRHPHTLESQSMQIPKLNHSRIPLILGPIICFCFVFLPFKMFPWMFYILFAHFFIWALLLCCCRLQYWTKPRKGCSRTRTTKTRKTPILKKLKW